MLKFYVLIAAVLSSGFCSDHDQPQNEAITKLDLSNKQLTSLKEYDFAQYPVLEEIDLSNNEIEHIKEKTFEKNTKLAKINLSGNKNLKFPKYSTLLISNIAELDLSNCNINKLPQHVFDGLRYLKSIDLSNNPIQKKGLSVRSLHTIESLQKLILPNETPHLLKELCKDFKIIIEIKEDDNTKTVQCEDYPHGDDDDESDYDLDDDEEENEEVAVVGAKIDQKAEAVEVPAASGILNVNEGSAPADANNPVEKSDVPEHLNNAKEDPPKTSDDAALNKDVPKTTDDANIPVEKSDLPEHLNNAKEDPPKTSDDAALNKDVPKTTDDAALNESNKADHVSPEGNINLPAGIHKKSHLEPRTDEEIGANAESNVALNVAPVMISPITQKVVEPAKTNDTENEGTEANDKKPNLEPRIAGINQLTVSSELSVNGVSSAVDTNKTTEPLPLKEINQFGVLQPTEANLSQNSSQTNMLEKMQMQPGEVNAESEKVAEVTETSNTGSTILIVLVVAVVVAGLAAFGYKFYKNKTYQASEPIERELKEVVATKSLSDDPVRDITEQEPLMNNHISRENGDPKQNNSQMVSNHLSTGPYQPTTTTFKPIDQVDDNQK